MTQAKHTPNELKHSQECVYNQECQKNLTSAQNMEKQKPTSELSSQENSKVEPSELASIVENQTCKCNGQKLENSLLMDTVENASAAGNLSLGFSPLTTSAETGSNTESKVYVGGDSTNTLSRAASQEKITGCYASTVIALGDNLEDVLTKHSPEYIRRAVNSHYELLELVKEYQEALCDKWCDENDLEIPHVEECLECKAAIAKAEGGAA